MFHEKLVRPYIAKVAQELGKSVSETKRIMWEYELLYNMEDWLAYIKQEFGLRYNFYPFKHPEKDVTQIKAKCGIIVSDKLDKVATNNPPLSDGGFYVCGACGADFHGKVDINIGLGGLRGFPISGTVTHEFGHAIHRKGTGFGCLSESFANFFTCMQIVESKDVPPETLTNITYWERLANPQYAITSSRRFRYQELYIFCMLHDNMEGFKYRDPKDPSRELDRKRVIATWLYNSMHGPIVSNINPKPNMWDTLTSILPANVGVGKFLAKYYARLVGIDLGRFRKQLLEPMTQLYRDPARAGGEHNRQVMYFELRPVPDRPGRWRVGHERAPQQAAFNFIRLQADPGVGQATVTLHGLYDKELESGWTFLLMKIPKGDYRNAPVYSSIGSAYEDSGDSVSISLPGPFTGDDIIVLVVVATPKTLREFNWTGGEKSSHPTDIKAKMSHPYELSLTGCTRVERNNPLEYAKSRDIDLSRFVKHAKGGGLKHPNAKVDSTVEIGPKCIAFEGAVLQNNARLLDCAYVVSGKVCDNAVMSGHSIMEGSTSVLKDNARLRDQAYVLGATVQDRARLCENGGSSGSSVVIRDKATLKGTCYVTQSVVSGSTVVEGDFYSMLNGELSYGNITGHEREVVYGELSLNIMDNQGWYAHYTFKRFTTLQAFDTYYGCAPAIARNGAKYLDSGAGAKLEAAKKQYILLQESTLDISRAKLLLSFVPSTAAARNAALLCMGSYDTGFMTVRLASGGVQAELIRDGKAVTTDVLSPGRIVAGTKYTLMINWELGFRF